MSELDPKSSVLAKVLGNRFADNWRDEGYRLADRHCPFVQFICEHDRKAFPTAAIQAINYSETSDKKGAELLIIWSTDVVTITGDPATLTTIFEALLTNQCMAVAVNDKTITNIAIEPLQSAAPLAQITEVAPPQVT